jgi:MFS family permease
MGRPPVHAWRLRYLLASTAVSVTGDGVLYAAAPLLAASLTDDPFQVAAVSTVGYLAWILMGLPAGALVDRLPRRSIMIVADLARTVALLLVGLLVHLDDITIVWLLVGVFIVSAGSCFFDPAVHAMIPVLVSRHKPALDRANSRLWSFDTLGRSLTGPPLGAALFDAARALPFLVDAASFLASAALVTGLPRHEKLGEEHPSILRSIVDGVRFMWTVGQLRALTIGLAVYNVGWNTAMATFVLFAQRDLGVRGLHYGLLLACSAIGGVVAGWLTPAVMRRTEAGGVHSSALLLQAGSWLLAFWAKGIWQVGVILLLVGAASNAVTIAASSARQHLSPHELIGRVVSATRLVTIGSAALGSLAGGLTAQTFGLRAPFIASAVLLAVGGLLLWLPLHRTHLRGTW